MNLYKLSEDQEFLPTVARFILDNFSNAAGLKVILPNGHTCLKLQEMLTKIQSAAILPNISPFSDLIAEGDEIFKIPSEQLGAITPLEEKIILAEIIYNYPQLNFNLSQALKFSHMLGRLFYDFSRNQLDFESIHDLIPLHNRAEHWQFIYEFLKHAHSAWKEAIKAKGMLDRPGYEINMLNAEIQRVKQDGDSSLIIAGILGHDEASLEFIKNAAYLTNAHIILPPIPTIDNDFLSEEDLYCLSKLLSTLGKELSDFKQLEPVVASPTLVARTNDGPTYQECSDIFQEAELISLIVKENLDKKIAIVLNNVSLKEYYTNFLSKYSLKFQDLLGHSLSKSEIFSFILCISELLCSKFELKTLFILLKLPLIISDSAIRLERLLLGKNRFISNWDQISSFLKKSGEDELLQWFSDISKLFDDKLSQNKFIYILERVITIAELLCPTLWSRKHSFEVSELCRELLTIRHDISLNEIEDFPEYLQLLCSGAKIFDRNYNKESNIVICKPEDIFLLKFDMIIIPDFNDCSWPLSQTINPWLSRQMQETLGLYSEHIKSNMSLYMFYLLSHNNKVIITRSKKHATKSDILPSNYLLKLRQYVSLRLTPGLLATHEIPNTVKHDSTEVKSQFFPNKISVSGIEMLVRSPYSFYAKKILNLKNLGSISSAPKLSEFGSFVHSAIEQYTKLYCIDVNKLELFLNCSSAILGKINLFESTKRIWRTKLIAIAEEFIEFDEQRRENSTQIYAESPGELLLNIKGFELKIVAIADRIEIQKDNTVAILDYKTGSLPTKKDVLSGLSPQLIIEALLCQNGGFQIGRLDVSEIVYVKISSSRPHIKTTSIELTQEDLMNHKFQMEALLEYYISNTIFSKEVSLLKYNDYKHLMRILNN